MKLILMNLLLSLVIVFSTSLHAVGQEQDHEYMAREYLSLIKQDRFDDAASLFHYP